MFTPIGDGNSQRQRPLFMVYLLIFGDQIEDRLGHFKFLIFYLVAGLVAAPAQLVTTPNSVLP
jgi:membrane associated rhomboid family serine protease